MSYESRDPAPPTGPPRDDLGWRTASAPGPPMSAAAANSLILVAIGLVFAVLMAGLVNMVRGGSSNTSQRLMRWRVGLQFVAILVVMAVLYLRG